MWTCKQCGERIEEQFDSCWKCSSPKPEGDESAGSSSSAEAPLPQTPRWKLEYRIFRGTFATWDQLFDEAAQFATNIGPDRVISISHSEDNGDGVVAVWFWTSDGSK